MGIIDIKLDKAKLGDLAKLNIFYNGNLESKLLLKALEDLLETTNTKVIAYTSKKKGTYLPDLQLYLVTKWYKKPYYRKDLDSSKVIYSTGVISNKRAVGKDSEQYAILTDIYKELIIRYAILYGEEYSL